MAVNAFYGPTNNGLWIPAGILQQPFFDYKSLDARNYGSIGAVLGHEMCVPLPLTLEDILVPDMRVLHFSL